MPWGPNANRGKKERAGGGAGADPTDDEERLAIQSATDFVDKNCEKTPGELSLQDLREIVATIQQVMHEHPNAFPRAAVDDWVVALEIGEEAKQGK